MRKQLFHIFSQSFGLFSFTAFNSQRCFNHTFLMPIGFRNLPRWLKAFVLNIFADRLKFLFHQVIDAMLGDFIGFASEFLEEGLTALFHSLLHLLYRFFYNLPFDKFIDSLYYKLYSYNLLIYFVFYPYFLMFLKSSPNNLQIWKK